MFQERSEHWPRGLEASIEARTLPPLTDTVPIHRLHFHPTRMYERYVCTFMSYNPTFSQLCPVPHRTVPLLSRV